jgi:hypothetical protein
MGPVKLDKILVQGIFNSEREMKEMDETKYSIYNKFTTIVFAEKDSNKSKLQTVKVVLFKGC